jgi:uncharacterized protein (UPF0264 family)
VINGKITNSPINIIVAKNPTQALIPVGGSFPYTVRTIKSIISTQNQILNVTIN